MQSCKTSSPKIRTGDSEANTVLEKSKSVKIVNGNLISNSETICIKYEDLFDINIDDRFLIDDNGIVLRVQNKTDDFNDTYFSWWGASR